MRSSCLTYCSTLLTRFFYSSCSSCSFMLFHSSYSTYCSTHVYCFAPLDWLATPLIQPAILLLLLDLLHSSYSACCCSCSTYCFVPLARPIAPLHLLNLLFHPSCLTYYFTSFAWSTASFLLLDLLLYSSCSTNCIPLIWPIFPLLFVWLITFLLLDLLLRSSCLTRSFCLTCSILLAWPIDLLLLFNQLLHPSCSTCCFTPFIQHVPPLLLLNRLRSFSSTCSASLAWPTLVLLLDLLYSFCLTYCFTPLVRLVSLLLFDLFA